MPITHTLGLNWPRSDDPINVNVEITADAEINLDLSIPDATTDQLVAFALDVSQLQALYIHSDQAILIQTNDGTTPDDSFTIAASKPLAWGTGCGLPNPFASTVDVTALYITNASGSTARLRIKCAYDATV